MQLIASYCYGGPGFPFIENKKQWDSRIDFAVRIPGGSMFLQSGKITYQFLDQKIIEDKHEQGHRGNPEVSADDQDNLLSGHVVRSSLIDANKQAKATPFGKLDSYHNYFIGSDSTRWSSHVNLYEGIIYSNIYEGIDLKWYSVGQNLKYDFMVAAGADPSQISFQYDGADDIFFDRGNLIVTTPLGNITEAKPLSYQLINGKIVWVKSEYKIYENRISFGFPEGYDSCYPLVIDPVLIFSTYSGSTADNWGSTATSGERGALYSAGVTRLALGGSFPTTPGSFQTTFGGVYDISILKYDSTGSKLLYATYLGGNESESAHSLVVNANHDLIVLGTTGSTNFPTSATAFDRTYNGGTFVSAEDNVVEYNTGSDIFVARFSKDGTRLVASTFLGGTANDGMSPRVSSLVKNYGDQLRGDIITNSTGDIFFSSVTSSSNFPVRNSFGLSHGGGLTDALIVCMDENLSQLKWGAFLGGSSEDASHTIQIDKTGDLFVAGGSASTNFPTTAGAYQKNLAGDADGWIAKLKGDGSANVATTFTGTSGFDQVYFLDLDREESVFVYGQTTGIFPITVGTYRIPNSGQFLQKFNNNLSALLVSTVFGSGRRTPDISPTAFLVNDCNNIYLTGWGGIVNSAEKFWDSNTVGMPITPDAFQKTTSGSDFYFIVLSIDATQLLYATYMGGTQSRTHVDGGTSRFDKGGVVYHAVCSGCAAFNATNRATSDFPTTANAWSRINRSTNCNNAAFKFDLAALRARIQTNSVKLNQPGLNRVCLPDKLVFQNISTGGQTYYWSFGDGTFQTKTDTARITHQYLKSGKYTIKLKVIDTGTCVGRDSTTTSVTVYSPLYKVGPDKEMCFDAGTALEASGGVQYSWASKDLTFNSSAANPMVNPKESSAYYVTVTDVNGCVKRDTVNVRVTPGIDLNFEVSKINDCYSRPRVKVMNLTDPAEDVFFDFGDGSTSDQDEDIHAYNRDGVYTVRIIGRKESCIYDKGVNIPVYDLRVPNVFTPNSSPGYNDTFKIGYGSSSISAATALKVSLKVFNRWGGKVYESLDYKDNWAGEGVASGIYYYEVDIEGEGVCKGWVHVIK